MTAVCQYCGKRLTIVGKRGRLHRHVCRAGRTSAGAIEKGTER